MTEQGRLVAKWTFSRPGNMNVTTTETTVPVNQAVGIEEAS
jgi:hypothetical protein